MEKGRRLELNLVYESKNITREISENLLSCTQTDSINELDSLEISIENRDMLWLDSWLPLKGESIKIYLELENWENPGKVQHDMGIFFIDSIDFSGPPDISNIKAISYNINSDIVDKRENKVWENVDFKTILKEIAKRRKIELILDINFNRKYKRLEQKLESDFNFIKKLCDEAGINFKLFNNKMVVFEEEKYEKKDIKATFNKDNLKSYSFSTDDTDSYSNCTISYYDYKKKKKIEKKISIKNRNGYKTKNKRTLFINEDKHISGKNAQEINFQLQEIAKKALRNKNKKEIKANITFLGKEQLLSVGDTVQLDGFGFFTGKYMIDNLNINLMSYEISAELHKILDMEVE